MIGSLPKMTVANRAIQKLKAHVASCLDHGARIMRPPIDRLVSHQQDCPAARPRVRSVMMDAMSTEAPAPLGVKEARELQPSPPLLTKQCLQSPLDPNIRACAYRDFL